jgi:hypothetical protein
MYSKNPPRRAGLPRKHILNVLAPNCHQFSVDPGPVSRTAARNLILKVFFDSDSYRVQRSSSTRKRMKLPPRLTALIPAFQQLLKRHKNLNYAVRVYIELIRYFLPLNPLITARLGFELFAS